MKIMEKKVGELNGWWAILFRLSMLVIPMTVGYGVYLHAQTKGNTERIIALEQQVKSFNKFMEPGARFTREDGLSLENKMLFKLMDSEKDMRTIMEQQNAKIISKMDMLSDSITSLRVTLAQVLTEHKTGVGHGD